MTEPELVARIRAIGQKLADAIESEPYGGADLYATAEYQAWSVRASEALAEWDEVRGESVAVRNRT